MRKTIKEIMGWKSENTFYDWKKQNRKIISLLEFLGEEKLNEFLATGKIEDCQKNNAVEKSSMDELIIYNVKFKIDALTKDLFGNKKNFWVRGFIEVLKQNQQRSKKDFLKDIHDIDTKWFKEHPNWKKMTIDLLNKNFSDLEIITITKNYSLFLKIWE